MAKEKISKTNAMRFLDQKKKEYEILTYEYDENHLGAEHVCEAIQKSPSEVFKTLIFEGNQSGYLVGFVPSDCEIDEKKLAKISGNKKVNLIPMKDIEKITGYIRGGVSPLGLKKSFPIYAHQSILEIESFSFSAGKRGFQIFMETKDLLEVCNMNICDIV